MTHKYRRDLLEPDFQVEDKEGIGGRKDVPVCSPQNESRDILVASLRPAVRLWLFYPEKGAGAKLLSLFLNQGILMCTLSLETKA